MKLREFMLKSYFLEGIVEAGCDEAGRGCLAGPVFAAVVILPNDYMNPFLDDSKQLTAKNRNKLKIEIEKDAIEFATGRAEVEEIDSINIVNASFLAVQRALEKLSISPEHIIMDGNRFIQFRNIPYTCIVKGDANYLSIAAASILAKTYRDEYMSELHHKFPEYDWEKNKGYPTLYHRKVIAKNGLSPHHRKTFRHIAKKSVSGI